MVRWTMHGTSWYYGVESTEWCLIVSYSVVVCMYSDGGIEWYRIMLVT